MAYALVQQKAGNGGGTGTTAATGAWGANTTAGNLIVVAVQYGTTSTVSVSDGINTYLEIGTVRSTGNSKLRIFYAKNITGGSTTQITATFGTSQTGSAGIAAFEYSGLDTAAPYTTGEESKNSSTTFGTGTDAITTNATPALSAQPAMVFGFLQNGVNNSHAATTGTGFTTRTAVLAGGFKAYPEDMRVTTTAGIAATWTTSTGGTDDWNCAVAVFKEASGGATATATPGVGATTASGLAPTLSKERVIQPGVGLVAIGGLSPVILDENHSSPGVGALQVSGLAPQLLTEWLIQPGAGQATLNGLNPVVVLAGQALLIPDSGQIVLQGLTPTLDTGSDASLGRGHVDTGRRWHGRAGKYEWSETASVAVSDAFPHEASSAIQPLGLPAFKPVAAFPTGVERPPYVVPPELLAASRARIEAKKKRRRAEEDLILKLLS